MPQRCDFAGWAPSSPGRLGSAGIRRQSVRAITTSLPEIVVSLAAVRIGAVDLGIGHVLGSNLFNLLILGLDDVFYRQGPLLADAGASHRVAVVATSMMYGLFLIGLTYKVMTKRFVVAWDTGAIGRVRGRCRPVVPADGVRLGPTIWTSGANT